jgi:hypothetical protein
MEMIKQKKELDIFMRDIINCDLLRIIYFMHNLEYKTYMSVV